MKTDSVIVIETLIDDSTPMELGYLIERLMEGGARDAYILPCVMKKSRPGHLVTALAAKNNFKKIADIIFRESPTTGLRFYEAKRLKLDRVSKAVSTRYGRVSVKVRGHGEASPEFESCRNIAKKKKVPLRKVYEEAKRKYEEGSFAF